MRRLLAAGVLGAVGVVALALVLQRGSWGAPPEVVTGATSPAASATASAPPSAPPSAFVSPSPSPVPSDVSADVPVVPVAQFRSAADGTTLAEVRATLAGGSTRFRALELVADEADPILASLGLDRPADPARLVLARDAATLSADLAAHRDRLAFLRADEVGPSIRALAWGGASLFGVARVRDLHEWPLTARLAPQRPGLAPFLMTGVWTLVAGGDLFLDRGVYQAIVLEHRGVDFPLDGGRAAITGHVCCSSFGWVMPTAKRLGPAGAMSAYLRAADLAIANFENPAPDRWTFHASGTVFSADPALIAGLRDAGIDWVSLANNHIGDAGARGIADTRKNLARFGIAFSGAGATAAQARRPAFLHVAGETVALLGYDAVAGYYAAGPTTAGNAHLTVAAVRVDIAAARAAGADVVIVYPHWGVEYTSKPTTAERTLAHAIIDAGADMVIGNHVHWAAAMEVYRGRPIWYALGNFTFSQAWSEPTMEGLTLEMTFNGRNLVQVRLRPHLILDGAQPNFLDPAGDGQVVLRQVFTASTGLLAW